VFQGGAAWRKRLMEDLGDQGDASALIDRRTDEQLAALMNNLGGHDLESILDAFGGIDHDGPVAFLCYTIKGYGLPLAGHKDNHAGLMTEAQMAAFRTVMKVREGAEWDRFEGLDVPAGILDAFLASVPSGATVQRRFSSPAVAVPAKLTQQQHKVISTQAAFGAILNELGRETSDLARHLITSSPDVTVSTNLGGWVNRRGVFGRDAVPDLFREQRITSAQKWEYGPHGQHLELGIAENNLFLLLGAAGLSHSLFGSRLLPIGTLYDPFIARGLDALNYACYQDSRFILVATPSGVALAPEGGAHQSINAPLIGLSQPGLTAFEPAYADELAVILRWALEYIQLPPPEGGSVYLRLSTRPVEQPLRSPSSELERDILSGGYWLSRPNESTRVVLAYQGTVCSDVIAAAGLMAEDRRGVGALSLTSADRLYVNWRTAQKQWQQGHVAPASDVEKLLSCVPRDAPIVTVIDGHPATLSWLGGVAGHRVESLGVDGFWQTGTIADLYRHFGIDAEGIMRAVETAAPGRPIRFRAA
jgi:pyruvate dehydrogenase E1 component